MQAHHSCQQGALQASLPSLPSSRKVRALTAETIAASSSSSSSSERPPRRLKNPALVDSRATGRKAREEIHAPQNKLLDGSALAAVCLCLLSCVLWIKWDRPPTTPTPQGCARCSGFKRSDPGVSEMSLVATSTCLSPPLAIPRVCDSVPHL